MGLETLVGVLIWVVVIFIVAYGAHYVITLYFQDPIRKIALIVVGLVLLIAILYMIVGLPGGQPLRLGR
jgi:hypothetical protein